MKSSFQTPAVAALGLVRPASGHKPAVSPAFPFLLSGFVCLVAPPVIAQQDSTPPEPQASQAIVVTATRQASRTNELLADVTLIDRETIEQAGPATSLATLLARQPGIEMKTNGGPGATTSVYLRGASEKQVVVLIDGMRIGSATLGSANWAYLPLQQIDRVEILRGSASSLYGADAVGGVIQIFTRKGNGPLQMNAEAGLGNQGTHAASAGLSGSTSQWRYSLNMAQLKTDGFSAINNRRNPGYNPDRDGHRNTSASGSLVFTPARNQELGLQFLHSEGWNDYDSNQGGPASADHRHEQKLSSWNLYTRNRLMDNWDSTLKLGRSTDDAEQFSNRQRTGKIRTNQTLYQWQNDVGLPVGTALFSVERLEQEVSGTQDYSHNKRSINAWLMGWSGHREGHRLQFNLRQDRNSQFGTRNTGFIAYGYQFTDHLRANASYGTAFNAPTFNDLYWPYSGNPDLKPETARNREIALHYDTGVHHTSLTVYRNDLDDMIAWAPDAPGSWNWVPQNIASARLQGITLSYAGTLGDFDVRASADFQDPRDLDLDKILRYRARRYGNLSIGREYGAFGWKAELQASGKRYSDTANTQALAGYALLNLQAHYRLDQSWSLFARADNILDRDYVLVQDYNTAGATFFVGLRYATP